MSTALVKVPFHGDELEAVEDGGKVWVSLRRCCENLGIAVEVQLRKLKGKAWACMTEMVMHDTSGREQPLTVIDLETLPGWLFSIDARKVKGAIREKLARYQREAARVLADHFFGRKPSAAATDPAAIAAMIDELVTRRLASMPVLHSPAPATPRFTVHERLRFKGWAHATARQRSQVRRLANTLLDLRHGETPDVAGGPGGPNTYYGHQLAVLDEAIDRVREEYQRADAARGPGLFDGKKTA